MEPKSMFVFYLMAFICFLVAGLVPYAGDTAGQRIRSIAWGWIGLALVDFVLLYAAYKAS